MSDPAGCRSLAEFLVRHRPMLVLASGRAAGTEIPVDQARITLGRGPGADLAVDDPSLAREHARIEFRGDGFVLRALEPGVEVRLNGGMVCAGELKDGDRFELGTQSFEFVIAARGELAADPVPS